MINILYMYISLISLPSLKFTISFSVFIKNTCNIISNTVNTSIYHHHIIVGIIVGISMGVNVSFNYAMHLLTLIVFLISRLISG